SGGAACSSGLALIIKIPSPVIKRFGSFMVFPRPHAMQQKGVHDVGHEPLVSCYIEPPLRL
ncbi:hypothetical protein QNA27_22265, partial [Pantoea eucalypti]|uniref:hypothetical protein n=1 Tax=Pantoea eucalypti TaxID=470933 RepID=UPI0024B9C5AC